MENFIAYINNQPVEAVFPLTTGDLLDERLDEAYLTVYSTVKHYEPTSEVRLDILDNNQSIVACKLYTLSNDSFMECPVGSGRYKHDLYLLEHTKNSDGIVASLAITTNVLGSTYADDTWVAVV